MALNGSTREPANAIQRPVFGLWSDDCQEYISTTEEKDAKKYSTRMLDDGLQGTIAKHNMEEDFQMSTE